MKKHFENWRKDRKNVVSVSFVELLKIERVICNFMV